jgi:outer membrane lipoprotein SlyB
MKRLLIVPAVIIVTLLAGCGPNISSGAYTAQNYGAAETVLSGIVIAARPVAVGSNNGLGAVAGAVAGGVGGSAIGGGARANILGGLGGALVGGLLGNEIQKGVSRKAGIEYIVKTSRGRRLSIVQGQDPYIPVGSHVNVILGDPARVVPAGY